MAVLANGYTIQMHSIQGETDVKLYPYTRAGNVFTTSAVGSGDNAVAAGAAVESVLNTILSKNFVPTLGARNLLTFLNQDGTFQTIQDATVATTEEVDGETVQVPAKKGVVALTNDVNSQSESIALTQKAGYDLNQAIINLSSGAADAYVAKTQLGVASTVVEDSENSGTYVVDTVGVATLDTNGKVYASQLPSFVDDIVEVNITWRNAGTEDNPVMVSDTVTYAANDDAGHTAGSAVTLEAGKIYVDATTANTYRFGGASVGLVLISESLALGTTHATAGYGDESRAAYTHSLATHARIDATKVEDSTTNGNILVFGRDDSVGTEVTVYEHPIASGFDSTNPHGITKATIGLGSVENKSSADIRGELTASDVTTALTFNPATRDVATDSTSGLMSAAMVKKLEKTEEIYVSASAPTPTAAAEKYLWYEIIEDETTPAEP